MRLWIDTNEAWSTIKLRHLSRAASVKGVAVAVHAQTYLEMRRQLRVKTRDKFDEALFDGFLRREGIAVIPLEMDQLRAAAWADLLYERYPNEGDWEAAKQRTLGGELRGGFTSEPGAMPMTTDWLIALTAAQEEGAVMITRDTGEEWERLRCATPARCMTLKEAMDWLAGLPQPSPGRTET